MSHSKIHVAVIGARVGVCAKEFVNGCNGSKDSIHLFCENFIRALESGLSNHYIVIWDNYSVGGDQIEYAKVFLSRLAASVKSVEAPNYRVVCASNFETLRSSDESRLSDSVMYERIHACVKNLLESITIVDGGVLFCVEEIMGPTLRDDDLDALQKAWLFRLTQSSNWK